MTPNSDKCCLRATNEMWCIHIYITSKLLCLLNIYTCQVLSQFSAKKSWVFKIRRVHILEIIFWFIKTKCLAWWTVKMLQKQQPKSSQNFISTAFYLFNSYWLNWFLFWKEGTFSQNQFTKHCFIFVFLNILLTWSSLCMVSYFTSTYHNKIR